MFVELSRLKRIRVSERDIGYSPQISVSNSVKLPE